MNTDLGYKPVTFSELTDDQSFWKGCQTCKNVDVLTRTNSYSIEYDGPVKSTLERIKEFVK